MLERLADKFALHRQIVQQENIAGGFIPTIVDLFPSVFTSTLSKALSGLAAANLSWMHGHSVVSHVLGSVQEKGRLVNRFMQTTVIRSTISNNFAPDS